MAPRRGPAASTSAPDDAATKPRPRTRSQKPALETPASPSPAPSKQRRRPPGIREKDGEPDPVARRTRNKVSVEPPREEASEDELNISPSKRTRPARNGARVVPDINEEAEGAKPKPRTTRGRKKIEARNSTVDELETPALPVTRRSRKNVQHEQLQEPTPEISEDIALPAPVKRGRKIKQVEEPLPDEPEVAAVSEPASLTKPGRKKVHVVPSPDKPEEVVPPNRGRKEVRPEENPPDLSGDVMFPAPVTPAKKTRTRTVQDNAPPITPIKRRSPSPIRTSPSKRAKLSHLTDSPSKLSRGVLPEEFHACLNAQKRAILVALQRPPLQLSQTEETDNEEEPAANELALQQLDDLLRGTVQRGEGNSCLLIGPRSSGKTRIVAMALSSQSQQPIIIRLSGHVQTSDRLAMREIARQAAAQTGSSFLADSDVNEPTEDDTDVNLALPPSSHLPALISVLPTLKRPVVVILDAFDLFALHPRQALLYCLLDTAQSCRVADDMNGIAVIGVTTRVDTINLLEKRVKSRFSGRMLRTASPRKLSDWMAMTRAVLTTPVADENASEEWSEMWEQAVDQFLADRATASLLNDTFALTRDVATLGRILISVVLALSPSKPFPTHILLKSATLEQRCPPRLPFLQSLSYPCMCLLVAAMHARTSGHDSFTFEMLHEMFRDQVRTSSAAPVQLAGGSVGMMKCSREVLMAAFEYMIKVRGFVISGSNPANVAKEFGKYRCMAEREEVKKAIEKQGGTNVKKWFSKAK